MTPTLTPHPLTLADVQRVIQQHAALLAVVRLIADHDGKLTGGDWTVIQEVLAQAEREEPV